MSRPSTTMPLMPDRPGGRAAGDQFALPGHEPRAHPRDGRYRGHRHCHGGRADLAVHPLTVEADDGLIRVGGDIDGHPPDHVDDGLGVVRIHAGPQHGQRGGPVHRAGVEVPRREPARQLAGHRGLSGAGRSVDRDDALEGRHRRRDGLGSQAGFRHRERIRKHAQASYARSTAAHWGRSVRSCAAPRRYTCRSSARERGVSTCASSRSTLGMAPGTEISVAQMSGTSVSPSARAA